MHHKKNEDPPVRHKRTPGNFPEGRLGGAAWCLVIMGVGVAPTVGCMPPINEHENSWYVWPVADILEALEKGEHIATNGSLVMPDGIAPSSIIAEGQDGTKRLRVQPAFAEGKPAAYVTTDVWLNVPEVWLQPAYRQIEDSSDPPTFVPGAPFLIDVEQESIFYSPFWAFQLAVVGPNAGPDKYTSTRDLLNVSPPLPLRPGGWGNCPVSPLDFLPAPPGTHLIDPTFGFDLDDIGAVPTRFNGEETRLLSLGRATVQADAHGLIEALPFFVFARRDSDGRMLAIADVPRVAGVAALRSGRTGVVTANPATGLDEPRLGMYWQLVLAVLPSGADAFHAAVHAGAVAAAADAGIDIREYEGRTALNAMCFDGISFPLGCSWLDTQARIESALGTARIVPTRVNVNSAFVSFNKAPVHH